MLYTHRDHLTNLEQRKHLPETGDRGTVMVTCTLVWVHDVTDQRHTPLTTPHDLGACRVLRRKQPIMYVFYRQPIAMRRNPVKMTSSSLNLVQLILVGTKVNRVI